jgi:hypothetical protein
MAFPNPFNNQVTISYKLPAYVNEAKLKIVEAGTGRIIFQSNLSKQDDIMLLESEKFINGVYICSIIPDNGASKHFKLISIK